VSDWASDCEHRAFSHGGIPYGFVFYLPFSLVCSPKLKLRLVSVLSLALRSKEGKVEMEAATGGVRGYGTMSPAIRPHRRRGLSKAAVVVIIPVLALTATLAALVLDPRSALPRIVGLSRCRCERSVHQRPQCVHAARVHVLPNLRNERSIMEAAARARSLYCLLAPWLPVKLPFTLMLGLNSGMHFFKLRASMMNKWHRFVLGMSTAAMHVRTVLCIRVAFDDMHCDLHACSFIERTRPRPRRRTLSF